MRIKWRDGCYISWATWVEGRKQMQWDKVVTGSRKAIGRAVGSPTTDSYLYDYYIDYFSKSACLLITLVTKFDDQVSPEVTSQILASLFKLKSLTESAIFNCKHWIIILKSQHEFCCDFIWLLMMTCTSL